MEEIILNEVNGEATVSSREISEKFGKEHKDVLEMIRNLMAENSAVKNMISEGIYKTDRGRKYPEFNLTRDGFSLIVMGFTGSKALDWKLKYIEAFNKMEAKLKDQNSKALPTTYKDALLQLVQQIEDNEKLLDEVDRYTRFLCEKTGHLAKSDLAKKLDVSFQRLASVLKKVDVYTPTSQVKQEFLEKYPNLKLIIDLPSAYKDKSGEEHNKSDWQWTYEGAKAVVDYLIEIGIVTYTENNGFKLTAA
jgi:anti-repressor protein